MERLLLTSIDVYIICCKFEITSFTYMFMTYICDMHIHSLS